MKDLQTPREVHLLYQAILSVFLQSPTSSYTIPMFHPSVSPVGKLISYLMEGFVTA